MIRKSLSLALVLVLAACGGEADKPQTDPSQLDRGAAEGRLADAKVVVDSNGLAVRQGDSREAPRFGTPRGEVDALLTLAYGAQPERSSNDECGIGPTDFSQSGPLRVAYQDDKFVGWFVGEGKGGQVVTGDGVRPGTSMAALRDERPVQIIADSTLEGEFQYESADYGMITGFFSGSPTEGKVTGLAAGMNCFFR
mgnify:CR=1 FL=1|tara:strand:+ start:498 stop:1085 length:588 start_codon:yes stop_codon:yes gene_type:complete